MKQFLVTVEHDKFLKDDAEMVSDIAELVYQECQENNQMKEFQFHGITNESTLSFKDNIKADIRSISQIL